MNDPKVYSAFHNLENLSNGIRSEVNALMGSISEWAYDIQQIIKKENEEFSTFLLPKTPKERQTRRRKARNVLNSTTDISSTSVINSTAVINSTSVTSSTFLQNETCDLDGTISTRTRNARRAATSKMSELNITKSTNLEESKQEIVTEKSFTGNASEVTFVVPKASTRTKPVLKVKQTEAVVPEPEKNEISEPAAAGSENISPQQKKVSRIEPDRPSRNKRSTSPGESSEERLSGEKTPVIINETPVKRLSRRKTSETLGSVGAAERSSTGKVSRTLSESPVVGRRGSSSSRNQSKTPTEAPKGSKISEKGRSISASPRTRSRGSKSQEQKAKTPEVGRGSLGDKTVTIKKELTSTFILPNEAGGDSESDKDRTPIGFDRFSRISKIYTPVIDLEKTPVAEEQNATFGENQIIEPKGVSETATITEVSVNETEEAVGGSEVPKKKRKVKSKEEEVKENIQEPQETMRITRTKSKALKQMMEENETKQAELSSFAKKVLNKAKMTSVKKTQLAALLECNSSTPGRAGNGLPFGNLTASKSKYHLLLSSSKKLKIPGGPMSVVKASADKRPAKPKIPNGDAYSENLVRTASKPPKHDLLEKEVKLKSRKEKEEEAALKRQNVIKNKQEELRRKNELKHQLALKQREKLEQEKYHNMIQSEKEKEERHKLILQERQAKVKEEAQKRKLLTQQKIAETVERRRMEEEARIAKLKEMEAEEQRLALEKQKEQERQERRAQERLAQKKAREEYEMQMKQELEAERLKAEKLMTAKKCLASASKMPSACKRQRFGIVGEKREWDYKPRNEHDYGLEDEHSEIDSEDEKTCSKSKPVVPWAKKILDGKSSSVKVLTLEMICEFLPCYQKSPDIYKMFKMTPSKRIKRSSSAIWNTPSS